MARDQVEAPPASIAVRGKRWIARPRLEGNYRPSVELGPSSWSEAKAREAYLAACEAGLVAELLAVRNGAPAVKPDTVGAIIDRWCPLIEASDLAPATRQGHLCAAKGHVHDKWAGAVPAELTTGQLREWLRELQTKVSTSRTRAVFFTLAKMLDDAIAENWIDCPNPCRHPKVRDAVPAIHVPDDEDKARHTLTEARAILASTTAPERRLRYLVAFTSLMRDGELAGLRWCDLADEKGVLVYRVRGALARVGDEGWATRRATKTAAGRRLIAVHPLAAAELAAWRAEGWEARVGRAPGDDDPIFPNVDGTPFRPRSADLFREDLAAAGLPLTFGEETFEFRSTRRSGATWLEALGAPPELVDRLMGHGPKGVRGRHYSGADLEHMRRWIAAIDLGDMDATVDPPTVDKSDRALGSAEPRGESDASQQKATALATLKTEAGASLASASKGETTAVRSTAPGPSCSSCAGALEVQLVYTWYVERGADGRFSEGTQLAVTPLMQELHTPVESHQPLERSRSSLQLLVPTLADKLDVRSFRIVDGLSKLFSVELEVACENPAIDFEELVGAQGAFYIELDPFFYPGLARRSWSGVISEAHQVRSESKGLSSYRLTLSPRLWLLTRRTNCRVYQQLSDLDVVLRILREWGVEPEVSTSRAHKTRKCRVQYQETDYAFMSRLLEAAGVTFLFREKDGESQLVLRDSPERGEERDTALDHVDEPNADCRYATELRASRTLSAGQITVADHDHRLANMPLLAQHQPSRHAVEAQLESFRYSPGSFRFGNEGPKDTPHADDRGRTRTDTDEGRRIAEQLGSANRARARCFTFESNALDLGPGLRLSIANHPAAERAGQLLLVSVTFTGKHDSPATLECQAVTADTPFRPELVTPVPQIQGVENAVVVGPAGETIHCDEFGRVRVQFHWDRYGTMDEQSSIWVPVNQSWAGDGLGAINLPRVGQEVIVSFLGGNPEEPMIIGRMFTNLLRPPFALPANKTQNGFKSASVPATGGYNELMFEDKAGNEEIRMRAEKDWNTRVNNDKTLSVGRDRSADIASNDSETVGGNQQNSVVGMMKSAVGLDKIASVLGNLLSMTGGQRILDTIGDFVSSASSHRVSSSVGTTLSVGSSMIHIAPDSITIQSPKILLRPGDKVAEAASLTGDAPGPAEG